MHIYCAVYTCLAIATCTPLPVASQSWYSRDDSIVDGAVGCYYMNQQRELGRICVAQNVMFDRKQQDPGQDVSMLVSIAALTCCTASDVGRS